MTTVQAKQAWDDYWHQGHLTSFGDQFDNYKGVLAQEWQLYFQQVKSNNSVLDLATGNGAILELALHCLQEANAVRLVGVDYAKLNHKNSKLELKSNINIEDLPFANEEFDFISSQFGVEYADISKALPEAFRVLKPKGRLQFICHHIDSEILKNNSRILACTQQLIAPDGPAELLLQLLGELELNNTSANDGSQSEKIRNQLNASLSQINEEFGHLLQESGFLSLLRQALSSQQSFEKRKALIQLFKDEQQVSIIRLQELKSAALTADKITLIKEVARKHNITELEVSEVRENNYGLIGLKITANKK